MVYCRDKIILLLHTVKKRLSQLAKNGYPDSTVNILKHQLDRSESAAFLNERKMGFF